ncbi:MAG: radical SAM protein [Candidatus Altiarchaeota archaeon]
MKVLLLSPPFGEGYMRNARCDYFAISDTQWYPIWLSYAGALLEREGHKVELIDAPAENLSKEDTLKRIGGFSPDLAVLYSSTKSEEEDFQFAGLIKERTGSKTAFVGPFVSIHPKEIASQSKVDYVIKGEFDYPLLELAQGKREEDIKNLYWKKNGIVNSNPTRPLLDSRQLDELPFVTDFYRRHLDIKRYHVPQELYPFVDLFTGRGCAWGHCTFCLWVHSFIPGQVYNLRSIGNVIEEIKFVKQNIKKAKEVFIQDDTLTSQRARELSNAILSEGIDMIWSCYARGNMDAKTLVLMKKAGCRTLHVGYESASNKVLKNTKKGLTAERMTKFTKEAKKAGLRIHGDFLMGLPGETRESIKKTISWAKELDPETAQFSIMNPYLGTPFYEELVKQNALKDGEPDYKHLPSDELRVAARKAVREFYMSPRYLKRMIFHPREYLFPNIPTMIKTAPYMLWKRW